MTAPAPRRYSAEEFRQAAAWSRKQGWQVTANALEGAAEDAAKLEQIDKWARAQTITAFSNEFSAGFESGQNAAKNHVIEDLLSSSAGRREDKT